LVTSIIEEIDQCIYENGSVSVSIYDRLINLLKRQLLLSYGKIFDIATDIVEPTKADVVTAVGNVWTTKRLTKASK
jgi:RNA-binding protein YhbY